MTLVMASGADATLSLFGNTLLLCRAPAFPANGLFFYFPAIHDKVASDPAGGAEQPANAWWDHRGQFPGLEPQAARGALR
jgi:hypothetical protein